ncbi:MAG: hypothetical protein ACTHKT_06970 [Solirubrobacterales bacterium]
MVAGETFASRFKRGALGSLVVVLVLSASGLTAAPASANTSEEIAALPVLDTLNRNESPLSNGGKWAALAWASNSSGHATGRDTESGWGPSDAFSAINGAYWTPSTFGDANGSAAAITMQAGPSNAERYVSLWLDMANPGTTKSGYQLRWRALSTGNTYKVTLSKWSSGTETVLAELASTEITPGTTIAITDTGSTVTAWKGSGGSFTSILSAGDWTLSSGYAGIEASGNISRSLNFKAGSFPSTAERLASLPVLDALNRSESPLSNNGKWAGLGWDTSTSGHATGQDTTAGWGPYDAFSTVNGAYWTPSTFSDANGDAAAITMQTAPGIEERYVSLWLDMSSPTSGNQSGYQLRWRELAAANTYKLTLSKWAPPTGKESVLAELASTEIAPGTTLAITDTGGTVTAWKSTGGGSFTSILSAADSSFSSGYAGIEASGNISRSLNFKAGTLNPPPDTTVTGGPTGVVVPNVSLSFTSSPSGTGFECSIDGGSYSTCASPKSYSGLTEGSHTFRVRATNGAGPDQTPAERSFQVVAAAKAVTKVATLDNFERQEVPLATGKWSKTSWAGAIGGAWCCSFYRGYGSNGPVEGAYWNQASFSDGPETVLVSGKVGTGAPFENEYLALWLDMPNPGSARSGYEARFSGVNGSASNYKVELSKWVAGTRTILTSATGVSLPVNTTMALTETSGGSLAVWTGTSSLSPLLTANDSAYAGGNAGIEVNGGEGTVYDFRAGRIDLQPPDTTIQSGPSGVVSPQNVSFTFTATESGSSFECSIDGGAYSSCSSPKSYPSLAAGQHTFRVRAVDAVGNQDPTPAERSFEVAEPPAATTGAAVGVESSEATLHGSVNPKGTATTYQFEYGTTTAYGKTVPVTPKSVGSGNQAVAVSELVTGLEAETTYHFRLTATSAGGTTHGSDETFTTPQPAPVHVLVFGQAAEAPSGALVSPQEPLSVSAGTKAGKIKELQLRVDGTAVATTTIEEALEEGGTESCFEGVCTLSYEYPSAFPAEIESGQHSFEVRAIDEAGNEASFTRQVLVDAGVPTLELGGSLMEADGTVTSSSATVTAHAQDGTGTYAAGLSSIQFYVDGVYQSGITPQCNSGCPAEADSSYEYLLSKWGSGPHELTVVTKDNAGNEDSQTVLVNKHLASVEPSCSTAQPTSAPVGTSASTTEATAAIEAILPAAVEPTTPDPEDEGFEPTLAAGKSASEGTEAFLAKGGLVGGRVVRGSHRAYTVGQGTCLVPMQTTAAESGPELLPASGAVVYANTAPETDTFLRNNGMGTTVIQSFRGPDAPTSLSWTVSLERGQWLEELADGAVAVVSSKGIDLPEAQVPAPPAGMDDPEKLGDVETVLDAASYELVKANNEVEGAVEAVIPPALVIASNGTVQKLPLTASGEEVAAAVPTGAKAMVVQTDGAPEPAAVCAAAFEDDPLNYVNGCSPEQFVGGERPYISGMDWAPDGSFVYTAFWDESGTAWEGFSDWNPAETFLYRASADGKDVEELETPGFKVIGSPKVSPDGTKIAFNGCSLVSFKCGVVLANADGEEGSLVAITEGHTKESNVSFSSDGKRLLYEKGMVKSPTREERQYYSVKLDGTGEKQLTNISQLYVISTSTESWEVHGTLDEPLAVDPSSDSLVLEIGGSGFYSFHESQEKATEANMTRLFEWGEEPAFNPAGTKIAYSVAGEAPGIYVMNPDGSGAHRVVPSAFPYSERAIDPAYSHDGSEIAYIRNGVIYRAPAAGGPSTLAVESDTSDVRSLAAAVTGSDPELSKHLPAIEAAETAYLAYSSSESSGPLGEGLKVVEAMNQSEWEFCILNPGECARFAEDRQLAVDARSALFTGANQKLDRSTRANAFQHGFWTALMMRSTTDETDGVPDGLMYALHHENKPYSWDARQDIVNDFVGYFWFLADGIESWEENGEIHFRYVNRLEVCQGLLPKGKNAIFIGGGVNPFHWIHHHQYEFGRLIFRKLRSDDGIGVKVVSNGRHCAEVWPVIS